MLAYLEQERRTEEDREAFISSEYWNLLKVVKKETLNELFNTERKRANDRIVNLLQSYRPSYVRGTGQVAGAADVGIFGLENLATSPLKDQHKNFLERNHRKSLKKSASILHIKKTQNNKSISKRKKKGKNSVLTYLKFEGVSEEEYEESTYDSDHVDEDLLGNDNSYSESQQYQHNEEVGDENLHEMYTFLQKDSNVIARFKTPPMSELYKNANATFTPKSSMYEVDLGEIPNGSKEGASSYGADLQQMPEMDMQSYNDHLMMMDGINMNKTRLRNKSMSLKGFSSRAPRRKKSHRKSKAMKLSPIKLARQSHLSHNTLPRRRKTNFSRLKQQRIRDKRKSVEQYFSNHPLQGSVKAGARYSKFKYKPIVEWNFPRGYKRPWEKPMTKDNLSPKPEDVDGHDFDFYGEKLNGQSPLLTIPQKRKAILPLKQHRGNKIEEAEIMDRLRKEKLGSNNLRRGADDDMMMIDTKRDRQRQKDGITTTLRHDDGGAYDLSHSVLSKANENKRRIAELQQQIQHMRSELAEVERQNTELDADEVERQSVEKDLDVVEEKKIGKLRKSIRKSIATVGL